VATAELSRRVEKVVGERVAGASVRPGERWMRRGRVELLVFVDLGQPPPRVVEQLVTLGRRRACLQLSRQLAQLYRSFFGWKHCLFERPWLGRGSGAVRRAALKVWNGCASRNLWEFHEALLEAATFEDLPGRWQAAIMEAEQNRPKLRIVSGD
jgi:hypothetical protein